jgi:hypothetical protein
MKTTLRLPDHLMREVKIRAAQENMKLQDLVADLIRIGLAQGRSGARTIRRVRLPLVRCAHPARPDQEVTPGRAAEILLDEEARGSLR